MPPPRRCGVAGMAVAPPHGGLRHPGARHRAGTAGSGILRDDQVPARTLPFTWPVAAGCFPHDPVGPHRIPCVPSVYQFLPGDRATVAQRMPPAAARSSPGSDRRQRSPSGGPALAMPPAPGPAGPHAARPGPTARCCCLPPKPGRHSCHEPRPRAHPGHDAHTQAEASAFRTVYPARM